MSSLGGVWGSYILSDALLTAETTSRTSADNALDARLDIAEAKSSFTDPTTQSLLTAETNARTTALAAKAPKANAEFSGTLAIGSSTTKSVLGLTIHETGNTESGISIYATGGSDACVDLLENSENFGVPSATGFRVMFDGGKINLKSNKYEDDFFIWNTANGDFYVLK